MNGLGFAIGVSPRRRTGFDPASLVTGGTAGLWIDPSDLASMFQDAAGTVPAAIDAPVGRVLDKSGRGNHATQSVAASRPMLRRDTDGRHSLEFDGVDDFLHHGFGVLGGDATLSCAAQRTGGTGVVGLLSATPPNARLQAGIWGQTIAPNWGTYAGGAHRSAGADAAARIVMTVVGRASGDVQRLLSNGGGPVEYTGSFAGDANDRRAIGREFSGLVTGHFNGRVYALFGIARALAEDELRGLIAHQAAQAGVRT